MVPQNVTAAQQALPCVSRDALYTEHNCNPTPPAFSSHLKQWEYSCRPGCQFPSEQAGISLGDLTLAQ